MNAVVHGGDIYRNRVRLDFSANINPLGIPCRVKTAMRRALHSCRNYPDPKEAALRRAVSSRLGIPETQVVFGNGASELFIAIVHALKPGKILIPVPSFSGYEYAAQAVESRIVYYPLTKENGFVQDEDFQDVLTEDTDLLFLSNPNNPTGKQLCRERLEQWLEICRRKNIFVVLDECFAEFCEKDESLLGVFQNYPNLLLVRAFTKIYAIPGVRLGYLVSCNEQLLEKIEKQLPEWNVSVFAQAAGTACMQQNGFVKKTVAYVSRERKFLTDQCKAKKLQVYEGEANYILLYCDWLPLYEELLKRGILIRDCRSFRGLGQGYYRIAVRTRKENKKFLKALGECIDEFGTFVAGGN